MPWQLLGDANALERAVLNLLDNAVLHAGTEFEVKISISDDASGNNLGPEVTVVVTDRGPGPLELHLAMPRTGRAATHGRGLLLVERLATEWGTRHDANGRHQTWFGLRTSGGGPERVAAPRNLGALGGGRLAGSTRRSAPRRTGPGTASGPAGAVSSVGALPPHRRRGHLTRLMNAQLADAAERGASEPDAAGGVRSASAK